MEQKRIKWTPDLYFDTVTELHKGKFIYDRSSFININHKITATCTEHNRTFSSEAGDHYRKKTEGPCCRAAKTGKRRSEKGLCSSLDHFIGESVKVHKDDCDYTKVVLRGVKDPVEIMCAKNRSHGSFFPSPTNHVHKGTGCPTCYNEIRGVSRRQEHDEFILDCIGRHGDRYDYSETVYTHAHEKIIVICKLHGRFSQRAYDHKKHGGDCCYPAGSKPETDIGDMLEGLGIRVIRNYKMPSTREIDAYCPDLNLGFEYDGFRFHNDSVKKVGYHLEKTLEAKSLGIRMIHIIESDWISNEYLCRDAILKEVGNVECLLSSAHSVTEQIGWREASEFHKENNTWGPSSPSAINLGIKDINTGNLVSVMSMKKSTIGLYTDLRITKFSSKLGVPWSFSHLIDYVRNNLSYGISGILGYSYLRWDTDKSYSECGFEKISTSGPDYLWVKGQRSYAKEVFTHDRIRNTFKKYDATESIENLCRLNGYTRLYDCGRSEWKLTL